MSDTSTQTSVTQTSPSSKDFAPCSGKCRWNIRVLSGFVPNVRRLYWMIRKSDIQKAFPLTRAEVLSQEMCLGCSKRAGFETMPTADMLSMMEAWSFENVQRKEDKLDRDAAFQQRQRARSLELAVKHQDRNFLNRLFAEQRTSDGKPRPKHRTHKHIPGAPQGPKKYGDERKPASDDQPKRRKKGKQDDDQKKQKKGAR